jgi:hypothetical protein
MLPALSLPGEFAPHRELCTTEHIVAAFETEANATAAERDLEGAGIPSSAIRQYADTARAEATEHASAYTSGGGFWSWLFGDDSLRETPAYTPDAYDRSAVAGNVVLSVTVHDETQVERVIAALEAHHPVDIDEDGAPGQSGSSAIVPPVGLTTSGHEFPTEEVASPSAASAYPSGAYCSCCSAGSNTCKHGVSGGRNRGRSHSRVGRAA